MTMGQSAAAMQLINKYLNLEELDFFNHEARIRSDFASIGCSKPVIDGLFLAIMASRTREAVWHEKQAASEDAVRSASLVLVDLRGATIVIGDTYNNSGQAGNLGGQGNNVEHMTMTTGSGSSVTVNWSGLASDLSELEAALPGPESDEPDDLLLKGAVKGAQAAVKAHDESKLLKYLGGAVDLVKPLLARVGGAVLTAYIESKLGVSPSES